MGLVNSAVQSSTPHLTASGHLINTGQLSACGPITMSSQGLPVSLGSGMQLSQVRPQQKKTCASVTGRQGLYRR